MQQDTLDASWVAGPHAALLRDPMLLLDRTGSMTWATSETDPTPRNETLHEAINVFVGELQAEDTQARYEREGGGVRTVTFAGGSATDMGFLNLSNLRGKWDSIRWGGGTKIMPGWNLLQNAYNIEFARTPPQLRPLQIILVVTDGEADDILQFEETLDRDPDKYVIVACMGFGATHEALMQQFQKVQADNPRVKVVNFVGGTDPRAIAVMLKNMIL